MSEIDRLKNWAVVAAFFLSPLASAQSPSPDPNLKQKTCSDTELQKFIPQEQRQSPAAVELIKAKAAGQTWTWIDRSGCLRTQAELNRILAEQKPDEPVDLRGAILRGAILVRANLGKADLTDSDLTGADLAEANLAEADLTGAELTLATLGGRITTITRYPETGRVQITKRFTDLRAVIFEPKSLPQTVSPADNLQFMTYDSDPSSMVKLRKQLQETGFRQEEREITYALYKRRANLSWEACYPPMHTEATELWLEQKYATLGSNCLTYGFNRLLFDLPSAYGMRPARSLILVGCLWAICSFLYAIFIHRKGRSGLYRIKKLGWADKDGTMVLQIRPRRIKTKSKTNFLRYAFRRELRIARTAMFFSLMSAFNLGFHEIDFGRWLRLLTKREYDIKPVGAARAVSGWQSLISLYLVALWVLTYFGRPFE